MHQAVAWLHCENLHLVAQNSFCIRHPLCYTLCLILFQTTESFLAELVDQHQTKQFYFVVLLTKLIDTNMFISSLDKNLQQDYASVHLQHVHG